MATCNVDALTTAIFEVQQDATTARTILDTATGTQPSTCATWADSVLTAAEQDATAYAYAARKAALEMTMAASVCTASGGVAGSLPVCRPDTMRFAGSDPTQISPVLSTALARMDPTAMDAARSVTATNSVLSSLCDSYRVIRSDDRDPAPYQVVLCATSAPPASTFAQTLAGQVCSGYRTQLVPALVQTDVGSDVVGASGGVADTSAGKMFYHAFVCMGKTTSTSTDYKTAVTSMLDAMKTADATSMSGTSGLLGGACPCGVARQMAPFLCARLRNMAGGAQAAGDDVDTVAALNLPSDGSTSSVLGWLSGNSSTDAIACSDYAIDPSATTAAQIANAACGSLCKADPAPPIGDKPFACGGCGEKLLRAGILMPQQFAVAAPLAAERVALQAHLFCDICNARNKAKHWWQKGLLDIAAYGGEALADVVGMEITGPMALTCGDCPQVAQCADVMKDAFVKEGYGALADKAMWGCAFDMK